MSKARAVRMLLAPSPGLLATRRRKIGTLQSLALHRDESELEAGEAIFPQLAHSGSSCIAKEQGETARFDDILGPAKRSGVRARGTKTSLGTSVACNRRRAHNSAVECHLHTVEVVGSNPAAPTIESTTYSLAFKNLGPSGANKSKIALCWRFCCCYHVDQLVMRRPYLTWN